MASFGVMTAVGDRDAASSAAQRQTSPSSSSTSSNANSEMRAPCPSAVTRTSSAGHVTTNSGHVTAVEANHTDLRHIDSNSSGSSSNSEHCQPSASLVTCVVNHAIADDDATLLHPTKPPIPPKPPSLRSSSKHDSIASDDVTTGGEDERRQQLVLTSSTQHEPPHSPEMNRLLAARCVLWLSEADDLIEQSRNADQLMDYSSALQLCLEATKVVERVLTSDNVSHDVLMRARVKHGECINKSQILQRRKNIKQHATEVGRDRMSMVEADRYNTPSNTGDQFSPSTDVVMPPTHPSHSTYERGDPPPKPSASRLTNERLEIPDIEVLAANDRTASLIDFDKPGITRLQHWVDELYQKQHHNPIRHHPASSFASHPVVGYRPMTSPSTPITTSTPPDGNLNNNNHLLAASGEHQSAPRSTAETARTNIFVFRRPEDDIAEDDCSEQRKYRSKTPQPSGVADDVSISQQRRAKTPTPSQRKNELRTRLARAQRPNSDVTLRSKYNDWQSVSLDDETVPTAPSRRRGHKSEDVAGKNAEAGHLPPTPLPGFSHLYAMPPAFRAGAPPLFPPPSPGSGIHPAAGLYPPPPMLYPQYLYEMMNYYASLSPEQRSLIPLLHNPPPPNLSAAATNTLTVQPPGYLPPTATTTVTSATSTTAYQELLRARLAQNMKNYSEGMVKPAAPTPQDEQLTNQNIYQMHKPKPHRHNNRSDSNTHSISSKLRTSETPVDDVSTTSGAATAAATTSAALRSSKVARQKPMSSGQRDETAVIDATQGKMKDFRGRQENEASSPVETRCHAREGMLKWADEAKKRPAGVAVPSQYRAKLLQNAVSNRNSPSVDRSRRGSSSSNQPADHWHHANVKSHGASPASPSASTMTSSHGDGGGETKRGESCELCGLAPSAPPGNKYCDSCRAYLGRFKPTANNLPPSKIT